MAIDISELDPKTVDEVKLSQSDLKTLEKLKSLMSPEEIEKATLALKVNKLKAASSTDGKPRGREFTNEFTPKAGSIFKMKIVDNADNSDIKNKLGVDIGDINSNIRTVALKIVDLALKEGKLDKDWTIKALIEHGTDKERVKTPKDKVVEGTAPAASTDGTETATPATVAENENEGEPSPFSEDELNKLAESE